MKLEDQALLSNYEQLTPLDVDQNVWLVRDVKSNKICVCKTTICDSPRIYHYLQRANINGIPQIYHIIEDDNQVILIEQYIHGSTAAEYFSDSCHGEDDVISMGISICDILSKLHQLQPPIICRDIKPSNIMIESGKWYLTDFNIARSFEPNQKQDTNLLGTASFAPPEQYGFGQTDARSDLYSLAVTMNVLLTGDFPSKQLAQGKIGQILEHATKLDPKDRFQDVDSFSSSLRTFLMQENALNSRDNKANRLHKKTTIIAAVSYLLWAFIIVKFSGDTLVDNQPATFMQEQISNLSIFLLTFLPYVYNANYFCLLDITLSDYEYKRGKYWFMRILYTILISFSIPLVLSMLFL